MGAGCLSGIGEVSDQKECDDGADPAPVPLMPPTEATDSLGLVMSFVLYRG